MNAKRTPHPSFWQRLQPRERRAVGLAIGLCSAALLWWVALQPAWTTLRQANAQHARLDTQLARMHALAQQARQWQAQPALGRDDSLRALENATQRLLGTTARLAVVGDQATVTLNGPGPEPLAQWLADVRTNARLTPSEAKLTQAAQATAPAPDLGQPGTVRRLSGPKPPTAAGPAPEGNPLSTVRWQGSVVFSLGR